MNVSIFSKKLEAMKQINSLNFLILFGVKQYYLLT